jgi:hypothetical protein
MKVEIEGNNEQITIELKNIEGKFLPNQKKTNSLLVQRFTSLYYNLNNQIKRHRSHSLRS